MDGAVLASGKRKLRLHLIASPLKSTLIGLGAGFLWLGSTAAVLLLSGTMRFAGRNEIPMLWLWIVSVFINSAMQELLVRGYLYQMLRANYHTAAAAAVTTALFTFLHAGAFEAGLVPVLNVVTMSLLMTAVLEYTQSLLAPTLMHFIWNSIGSVILGGVALAEDYPHCTGQNLREMSCSPARAEDGGKPRRSDCQSASDRRLWHPFEKENARTSCHIIDHKRENAACSPIDCTPHFYRKTE